MKQNMMWLLCVGLLVSLSSTGAQATGGGINERCQAKALARLHHDYSSVRITEVTCSLENGNARVCVGSTSDGILGVQYKVTYRRDCSDTGRVEEFIAE